MKNKKNIILAVGFIVILAGVYLMPKYIGQDKIIVEFDERGVLVPLEKKSGESDKDFVERMLALDEEVQKMMEADNIGGETPEETLRLFIDALKTGDTELASKYFTVNKKEQMAKELAVGLENEVLELLISDLEKEKIGSEIINGYRFTTVDEYGMAEFSFDLVFNEFTNVWKIKSL